MRYLSALLILGAAVSGCALFRPFSPAIRPCADFDRKYHLVIDGQDEYPEQAEQIYEGVVYLPPALLERLVPFRICKKSEGDFEGRYHKRSWIAQGYYDSGSAKIFMLAGNTDKLTVWHECMHAYDGYLDHHNTKPLSAWRAISGDVYDENDTEAHCDRDLGKDGLLDDYSRWNIYEDRAVFFAHCMHYLYYREDDLLERSAVKKRYKFRLKLDQLNNEGLFTEESYQVLRPLFK